MVILCFVEVETFPKIILTEFSYLTWKSRNT